MAYTIVKSNGTVLTTIPDGTINTTSTSIGLPGRNYAGYGQILDTNFVHMVENFAANTPPSNPLRGQLWYDLTTTSLKICPTDGDSNSANWSTLTSTASGGTTTFGAVTVTGNLQAGNLLAPGGSISGNSITVSFATVSTNATIANAVVTSANIGTLTTQAITTGSQSTAGTLTGVWTANGAGTANGVNGTSMWITGGNLVITGGASIGVRTDNYYYANGSPISFAGTYSNSNVAAYMPTYNGVVLASNITTPIITTGANTTPGTITGNWSLSTGSRLISTYADLAERFESDQSYEPGTVVEIGGTKEITAVKYDLSEDVFGVISDTAGYIMNGSAGDDISHPPVAVGGRVKVKVQGQIKKGQRLVSAGDGKARAAKTGEATAFNIIGRSLQNKVDEGIGIVEAFVKIN